jgi:O-antigen ligase
MKQNISIHKLRENCFYFSLIIFVITIPFSEALTSITSGLLLLQALILTSWKHPSVRINNKKSLLLITSVFAIYLIGMLFTRDINLALYELRKVIFWIVIPLAIFFSPRLTREQFFNVLIFFCLAVFAASLTSIVKLLSDNSFHIANFRECTLISHIRFSFHIILSIFTIICFLIYKIKIPWIGNRRILLFLLLAWFIYFLLLLKSLTGWIAFVGTSVTACLFVMTRMKSRWKKLLILISIIVLTGVPALYISLVIVDFYKTDKIDPENVDKMTSSGNPYYFDFKAMEKENGHLVWIYFCEKELRTEWNRKSSFKYDSLDSRGFPYSASLIRYLTSKGLRKDSSGVASLTSADIAAIENGIANHIFVDHPFSLYPRIYETIWELDHYVRYGDPNNQSASQRIEYIKASLWLFIHNPWLGIGTGNWKIKYPEAYREIHSKLSPENQASSHNQYLNYLVKFGIFGFLYIMFAIIVPVFRERHQHNLLFLFFLALMAFANLGDANLESHMGLSFFCFFYAFFLWNSPEDIKK